MQKKMRKTEDFIIFVRMSARPENGVAHIHTMCNKIASKYLKKIILR